MAQKRFDNKLQWDQMYGLEWNEVNWVSLRCNGNGNRSEEPLGNFETKLHETGWVKKNENRSDMLFEGKSLICIDNILCCWWMPQKFILSGKWSIQIGALIKR